MYYPLVLNNSMPRSGSTLLQNLLAQNPKHHCTSTNALLNMVLVVRDSWMKAPEFVAQGLDNIRPRMLAFTQQAIHGFYHKEFVAGQIVFDKSRGWLQFLELTEEILGRSVKVIVGIRDVRDILMSLERLYRTSSFTDHEVSPEERTQMLTIKGRAERLLQTDKVVGYTLASIKDVCDRGLADRLVFVPYHELTHQPVATVARVCRECGLPEFTCDPKNIQQLVKEDDTVYGMTLHTIRSQVERNQIGKWREIFAEDYGNELDVRYHWWQNLARTSFL